MQKRKMDSMKDLNKNLNTIAIRSVTKPTSLGTLVAWNISKALEKNPTLDIKEAITSAQSRLEQVNNAQDITSIISENPYERYLACAMLAWQQMGHKNAESLCRFVENKRQEEKLRKLRESIVSQEVKFLLQNSSESHENLKSIKTADSSSYNTSYSMLKMGPVVKLPVETKLVMHVGGAPCPHKLSKQHKAPEKDIMSKIEKACCLDSKCVAQLNELDAASKELRTRANLLARREAERVQLLERAENAWGDLELNYHKRLILAEEKEDDIGRQVAKEIEERNKNKEACTALAKELQTISEVAETDRVRLSNLEKDICDRACKRMQLNEECTKGRCAVAELSCKVGQLDRDLQLKEEQAMRRALTIESEADSARALTLESERAMREELSALRDQVADVSKKLLDEEAKLETIKVYLDDLRQEKNGMVEDLEGCKMMCDGRMQAKVDELKSAREQLAALKEKVYECQCKVPIDASVEVKRSPSLAALCKCTPAQRELESCSCTSMRTKLMSDLLADLFGGLQHELGTSVTQMPCQLLKCLEDKHNWDRASIVKNNLKDYFSQLLVGELDIAIATSIEKYHAKWVGQSCADISKSKHKDEAWQEQVIEQRAQNLATQLAEQLFQERADLLTERAKEIVAKAPPCECKPSSDQKETATYPCVVKTRTALKMGHGPTPVYWHQAVQDVKLLQIKKEQHKKVKVSCPLEKSDQDGRKTLRENSKINELDKDKTMNKGSTNTATVPIKANDWQQALQSVTQLTQQIEQLKKDSLKKEDLKMMEKKFAKIVQRASGFTASNNSKIDSSTGGNVDEIINHDNNLSRYSKKMKQRTIDVIRKRKILETNYQNKKVNKSNPVMNRRVERPLKTIKNVKNSYAVNMCLCSTKQQHVISEKCDFETWKQKTSKDIISQSSCYKQSNPKNTILVSENLTVQANCKGLDENSCPSNCVCFHKTPSNTSIDKLLETLAKWKCDLDSSVVHSKNSHKSLSRSFDNTNVKTNSDIKQVKNELTNFKCKSNIEPGEIYQENIMIKSNDFLSDQHSKLLLDLTQSSNYKNFNENNINFGHMETTESEYMGAINLDKIDDDSCKCMSSDRNKKMTTFECINSNHCSYDDSIKHKIENLDNKMNFKKVNPEFNENHINMQQPVKDVTVLNMSKNNETSKPASLENSTSSSSKDAKTIPNVIYPCNYHIKFLGVTLSDANPSQKTKLLKEKYSNQHCIQNVGMDFTMPCKECLHKRKENFKKSGHNKVFKEKKSNSDYEMVNLLEFSKLTNNDKKDSENKLHVCNNIKKSGDFKQHKLDCSSNRFQNCENISNIGFNSCESENKKISGNKLDKISDKGKKNNNKYTYIDHSSLTLNNKHKLKEKEHHVCECSEALKDFKTFLQKTITKNENEDVALDVQSLTDLQFTEENCVCCNKLNKDYSVDLEQNTFHMLQEYLRKKLDEFKYSSGNLSVLPLEDEEKLFAMILQRVKKLILESTNQISCKCHPNVETSQGSWNRAYGLLQEYLKMKIRKVQCTCVLADDNKDTILPDVLEKVNKLIEYDFQRLQDACRCNRLSLSHANTKKNTKENIEIDIPEKDIKDMGLSLKSNILTCIQNSRHNVHNTKNKSHTSSINPTRSKTPLNLANVKSFKNLDSDMKPLNKDFSRIEDDQCCLFTNNCENETNNNKFSFIKPEHVNTICLKYSQIPTEKETIKRENDKFGYLKNKTKTENILNNYRKSLSEKNIRDISSKINCKSSDFNTLSRKEIQIKEISIKSDNKDESNVDLSDNVNDPVYYSDQDVIYTDTNSPDVEKVHFTNDFQIKDSKFSVISTNHSIMHDSEKTLLAKIENTVTHDNIPYIGCTIDKTWNDESYAHPNINSKSNTSMINKIMKQYTPNESYFKQVSYIMESPPAGKICIKLSTTELDKDVYIRSELKKRTLTRFSECETVISSTDTHFVLKLSEENIDKNHATTNTFDDNSSNNTNYSPNDDTFDWCECSSQCSNNNSQRIKNSIYYPAPFGNLNKNFKNSEYISPKSPENLLKKPTSICSCEMIPICHVKMLIENIESKLAKSSCTCDSMTPTVCPVHNIEY